MKMDRREELSRCLAGLTMMSKKSARTWLSRAGWALRSSQFPSLSSPMSGPRTESSTHGGFITNLPPTSLKDVVALVKSSKT